MTTANLERRVDFHSVLAADGRTDSGIGRRLRLALRQLGPRGPALPRSCYVSAQGLTGEVRHARARGRAVRDVWIMPRRGGESAAADQP